MEWTATDERVADTVAGYLQEGEPAALSLTNSDVDMGQLFVDLGIEVEGVCCESSGSTGHSVAEIPALVGAGSSTNKECARDFYEDITNLFQILDELESGEKMKVASMSSQAGVQSKSLIKSGCAEKEERKKGGEYGIQVVSAKGGGGGSLGNFVTDASLDRSGDSTSGCLEPSAQKPFIVFGSEEDKKMVARLLGDGSVMDLKRCPIEEKVGEGSNQPAHNKVGAEMDGGKNRKRGSGAISNGVVKGRKMAAKTGHNRSRISSGAFHGGVSCDVGGGQDGSSSRRKEIVSKGDDQESGYPSQGEEDKAWQVLFDRGVSKVTEAPTECWIRNSRTIAKASLARGSTHT